MKSRKPVIGIAAQYDETEHRLFLVEHYEQAVFLGGGIPVLLPLHAAKRDLLAVMRWCDGFLLPGGPDVSPFLFGEDAHEGCGRILPERDRTECMLVKEVLTNHLHWNKPLLGICRGIQVMNIAMGGSIYQDMVEQRKQRAEWQAEQPYLAHWQMACAAVPTHTVCLEPQKVQELTAETVPVDGWLGGLLGGIGELRTNSFHHQAIKQVADGFAVCGATKDGVIEAIHKEGHPFCLGIQWHAEDMLEQEEQRKLFEAFLKKAEEGM